MSLGRKDSTSSGLIWERKHTDSLVKDQSATISKEGHAGTWKDLLLLISLKNVRL